ncbi:SDR family oxidoreductase [Mesorhizobium sp. BH1-1-5]|uniref:SDR family oxidoreductase n=1 Tax=unclassified Mesorhizobium TaxID=325217 RepID=UPI001CC97385|nr:MULTISPECIES: SDR family oxidoreductase [unclassified Mesorhizobium]MBZ9991141.1 SDR family oxidoreductase [Mesorhizobium sp. BH1-1-5]
MIAFLREGADVAINYFPTEEPDAEDLAKLAKNDGSKLVLIPGDITEQDFCNELVETAAGELGGLDILVNNAAYQQSKKSIDEITPEQFDRTVKTNLYAMFWITKAALGYMKSGAAIFNTASVNSFNPGEELLDYATTKGGIAIFTKGLAKQTGQEGNSPERRRARSGLDAAPGRGRPTPRQARQFGQDTPLGRAGQPAELGPIYVALASNDLSFTHGSGFGANGGTGIV